MTNLGVEIEAEDDREAGGKRALLKMVSFLLFMTGWNFEIKRLLKYLKGFWKKYVILSIL